MADRINVNFPTDVTELAGPFVTRAEFEELTRKVELVDTKVNDVMEYCCDGPSEKCKLATRYLIKGNGLYLAAGPYPDQVTGPYREFPELGGANLVGHLAGKMFTIGQVSGEAQISILYGDSLEELQTFKIEPTSGHRVAQEGYGFLPDGRVAICVSEYTDNNQLIDCSLRYGRSFEDLRKAELPERVWGMKIVTRESDKMFMVGGYARPYLFFGENPEFLDIYRTSREGGVTPLLCRQSDGLFIAAYGSLLVYGTSASDMVEKSYYTPTALQFNGGVVRESDDMIFLAGSNGRYMYGTHPSSMNWGTYSTSIGSLSCVACRQSDGMFVAGGGNRSILYGTDPANLSSIVIPINSGNSIKDVTCDQETGEFTMHGGKYIIHGTDPANLTANLIRLGDESLIGSYNSLAICKD